MTSTRQAGPAQAAMAGAPLWGWSTGEDAAPDMPELLIEHLVRDAGPAQRASAVTQGKEGLGFTAYRDLIASRIPFSATLPPSAAAGEALPALPPQRMPSAFRRMPTATAMRVA